MNTINLTRGKVTQVCDCHFDKISNYKWCVGGTGYAIRSGGIYLHRAIMNAPHNKEVDHINGDKLDNRCDNLRLCSRRENCYNQPTRRDNKTGYRGVIMMPPSRRKRWKAYIGYEGRQITIGYFYTFEQAKKARIARAKELFGEFAYV